MEAKIKLDIILDNKNIITLDEVEARMLYQKLKVIFQDDSVQILKGGIDLQRPNIFTYC